MFEVTMQPGDNFRIAASLDGAELDKITDDTVTPDNNQVTGYAGRLSDMLTVWRHLWVERDSMTGASATNTLPVTMMGVTPNVPQPGTGGANDVIQLSSVLQADQDEFEGGVLSIPAFGVNGKYLPIYRNLDDTLNVPANSFTAGELAAIAAGGVSATITDDDVMPTSGTMHLPNGGALLQSAFGAAYILPVYVDPGPGSLNTVGTIGFVRHLADDLSAISGANRNLTSSASFWTTLVVGCFENYDSTDADPDGVAPPGLGIPAPDADVDGFDFGYSGRNGLDQNRSAIFLETIDDLYRQGQTAQPESLIVTHEIGHTVGSGTGHSTTGILREHPAAGDTNFDNETMRKFRTVDAW